tara:strand:+ start:1178 stop:1384 length:207 start_codon:yes stop_codon:yes gene_type:complete
MQNILRYGIPLLIVIGIIVAILNFKGVINSEIPVDYNPDPYPLHQQECPPATDTSRVEKNSSAIQKEG